MKLKDDKRRLIIKGKEGKYYPIFLIGIVSLTYYYVRLCRGSKPWNSIILLDEQTTYRQS